MAQQLSTFDGVGAEWMQTLSGRAFVFSRPSGICIEDIAGHLAKICRFNGACRLPYSVAEHSVRTALLLSGPRLQLAGLLHDAAEAYVGDIIRPLKRELRHKVKPLEQRIQHEIMTWAGIGELSFEEQAAIAVADRMMLATEHRDLMAPCEQPWVLPVPPVKAKIRPWSWRKAEARFLAIYNVLQKELKA